ncbi:MAG: histidine phosphatase family protein [Candidatus Poriferisodalaceae bacterium]
MVLLIVRHGRTVANAEGLLQGRVDNPLDMEGVRQAEANRSCVGSH